MSGAIRLLPLYAFIAWTETTLPYLPLTYLTMKIQNFPHKYETIEGEWSLVIVTITRNLYMSGCGKMQSCVFKSKHCALWG
jgi:hypothetical protein